MSTRKDPDGQLGLDQLLIYAAACIEGRGDDVTFEVLVAECFKLFPDRFHLKGFPHWPDAAKVNKSWLRCRSDKGWLSGSAKRGLRLTDAGRDVAAQVQHLLSGGDSTPQPLLTEKMQRMVKAVRRSRAFRAFQEGEAVISEDDLVNAIGAPPEASRVRLREQLRFAQRCADAMGDGEVQAFLRIVDAGLRQRLRRPWRRDEI